jgi:hypothetical protein
VSNASFHWSLLFFTSSRICTVISCCPFRIFTNSSLSAPSHYLMNWWSSIAFADRRPSALLQIIDHIHSLIHWSIDPFMAAYSYSHCPLPKVRYSNYSMQPVVIDSISHWFVVNLSKLALFCDFIPIRYFLEFVSLPPCTRSSFRFTLNRLWSLRRVNKRHPITVLSLSHQVK